MLARELPQGFDTPRIIPISAVGAVLSLAMAGIIADIIENHSDLSGRYHISSSPISKYDLLMMMREAYGVEIEIEPDPDFRIDRSLDSSRIRQAIGFEPASWPAMVKEMATDPTPYDEWRRTSGS